MREGKKLCEKKGGGKRWGSQYMSYCLFSPLGLDVALCLLDNGFWVDRLLLLDHKTGNTREDELAAPQIKIAPRNTEHEKEGRMDAEVICVINLYLNP